MKNNLIPEYRFPEFQNAPAWKEKKVEDLFVVTRGTVLAISKMSPLKNDEYSYPVYSSQTKNNGIVGYYKDYLFEDAITWTTDGANAGKVSFRKGKFYSTNVCGVLKSDNGYANLFIAEQLNRVTKKYVSYVGNPKLMNNVMAEIKIFIPSLAEQQKIADCLSSLDELIEAVGKKLEIYKRHKKGLMQKLFSQEVRFKDNNGKDYPDWEIKKFSNYIKLYRGSSPRPISRYITKTNGVNWIKIGDTKESNNYVISKTKEQITVKGSLKSRKVEVGELILANSMSFGKTYILNISGYIYDGWFVLREYEHFFNKHFLHYLLNSMYMQKQYNRLSAGGIVQNISSNIVYSSKLCKPSLPEQQKIADCLSSLDELIEASQKKVAVLKRHKKGLMQKLFPMQR